jgi:hypothetical protein
LKVEHRNACRLTSSIADTGNDSDRRHRRETARGLNEAGWNHYVNQRFLSSWTKRKQVPLTRLQSSTQGVGRLEGYRVNFPPYELSLCSRRIGPHVGCTQNPEGAICNSEVRFSYPPFQANANPVVVLSNDVNGRAFCDLTDCGRDITPGNWRGPDYRRPGGGVRYGVLLSGQDVCGSDHYNEDKNSHCWLGLFGGRTFGLAGF